LNLLNPSTKTCSARAQTLNPKPYRDLLDTLLSV
jgi:hypothetical protein